MRQNNKIHILDEKQVKLVVWQEDTSNKTAKLSKRERENFEVLNLLHSISPKGLLKHLESGAPIITNSKFSHISISHYRGWYALFLSIKPVGVDIQPLSKSLSKGTFYFLNKNEKQFNEELDLHLIWSAKEAFYKMLHGNIENLKEDVTIKEINRPQYEITINYQQKEYLLYYQINSSYVLVWC